MFPVLALSYLKITAFFETVGASRLAVNHLVKYYLSFIWRRLKAVNSQLFSKFALVKKIFPIIIVLISLSLAGTIYIQYNWLNTMLVNKQDGLGFQNHPRHRCCRQRVDGTKKCSPSLRTFRSRPGFNFPEQFQRELMRPATVAQKFTAYEVMEKLERAFLNQGLKKFSFEFAIIADAGFLNNYEYQLKSANFLQQSEDTVNNLQYFYPLQPPSRQ